MKVTESPRIRQPLRHHPHKQSLRKNESRTGRDSESPEIISPADAAQLLDYHAVAKLLGVTPNDVRAMVILGQLPTVRFGRSVRFDPTEIQAFVQDARTRGAA